MARAARRSGTALAALGLGLASCKTLDELYRSEVGAELARHAPAPSGTVTEEQLARLPAPVARHFRVTGFVGRRHAANMRIEWTRLELKRAHDAGWMAVTCDQFNSFAEPARLALMRGRMAGVIPFEGRDKYQAGHGQMLIRVLKVITVADATGATMDTSALVTFLSESLFTPSAALQPYITWQPIDDRSTRATLRHAGVAVAGTFHFDEAGRFVRFDTDDRWQDGKPPRRLPWSAFLGDYRAQDSVLIPTAVSATWHEPAGDFTYARGTIARLVLDVRE